MKVHLRFPHTKNSEVIHSLKDDVYDASVAISEADMLKNR